MRIRPTQNPMWKWWWPIGGVAVVALLAIGFSLGWSADLWAAAGVVAVAYFSTPMMAASLDDLATRRKQRGPASPSQPVPNPPQTSQEVRTRRTETSIAELPSDASTEISVAGERAPRRPGTAAATDISHAAPTRPNPTADGVASSEMLQRRIAATTGRPWRAPEPPVDRSWRTVGSGQFADLVWALSHALPSVSQADDTASRAGVTRHLIRKGDRDTAYQRWQAVLEQAIDDKADDVVCSEALRLTNSAELRGAIADWIGAPGGS